MPGQVEKLVLLAFQTRLGAAICSVLRRRAAARAGRLLSPCNILELKDECGSPAAAVLRTILQEQEGLVGLPCDGSSEVASGAETPMQPKGRKTGALEGYAADICNRGYEEEADSGLPRVVHAGDEDGAREGGQSALTCLTSLPPRQLRDAVLLWARLECIEIGQTIGMQ